MPLLTAWGRCQRCARAGEFAGVPTAEDEEGERTLEPNGCIVGLLIVVLLVLLSLSPFLYYTQIVYIDPPSVECTLLAVICIMLPAPWRCCYQGRRNRAGILTTGDQLLTPNELQWTSFARVFFLAAPSVTFYFGFMAVRSFDSPEAIDTAWGVAWIVCGAVMLPVVTCWGTLVRFSIHAQGEHASAALHVRRGELELDDDDGRQQSYSQEELRDVAARADGTAAAAAPGAEAARIERFRWVATQYARVLHRSRLWPIGHVRAIQTRVVTEGLTVLIFSAWCTFEAWGCRIFTADLSTRLDRTTPAACAVVKQANWATSFHVLVTWILRLSLATDRCLRGQGGDDVGLEDGSWVRLLERREFCSECFASKMSLFVFIARTSQIVLVAIATTVVVGLFAAREGELRVAIGESGLFLDDCVVGVMIVVDCAILVLDAVVLLVHFPTALCCGKGSNCGKGPRARADDVDDARRAAHARETALPAADLKSVAVEVSS